EQGGGAGEDTRGVLHQNGKSVTAHSASLLFSVLVFPGRRHVARVLDLVVADPGADHRPDHGVVVDAEVHHDGGVVDGHGFFDGGVDVLGALTAQSHAPVGLGQAHEVGDADVLVLGGGLQVGVGVAALVVQGLPLADHAEVAVVDDRDLDGDTFDGAGGQLLVGHLEAAVTVDRPHGAVGVADLGAQRGGHGESHGAQSTGVDEGAGALVVDELGGPHLVLAHARDVGGLWADHLTEAFDDVLRGQAFVGGLVVALGVGGLQAFELVPPGLVVALTALFLVTAHGHDQVGEDFSGITDD